MKMSWLLETLDFPNNTCFYNDHSTLWVIAKYILNNRHRFGDFDFVKLETDFNNSYDVFGHSHTAESDIAGILGMDINLKLINMPNIRFSLSQSLTPGTPTAPTQPLSIESSEAFNPPSPRLSQ
jgi:hypothetical protein